MRGPVFELLTEVIDYAGLFPPAKLPLDRVVRNYGEYWQSEERWMLGRLIVRLDDLHELARLGKSAFPRVAPGWPLSCLLPSPDSSDLRSAMMAITEFNQRHASTTSPRAVIDTLEIKVNSPEEVATVAGAVPRGVRAFLEIPLVSVDVLVPTLHPFRAGRLHAKFRTGGTTEDSIPSIEELIHAMACCAQHQLPFKATAGLHHPVRSEKALTYEQNSESATMHGFLNVLTASSILQARATDTDLAQQALGETNPAAFCVVGDEWQWNGEAFSMDQIREMRHRGMISFGSCSFVEAIEDLLGLDYDLSP